MRRMLVVLSVLGFAVGCASAPVIVDGVCRGCRAVQASGLCDAALAETICPEGQEAYIVNWEEVMDGVEPVTQCK